VLEQVWFAGVHSDVVGGYVDHSLGDCSLEWMLEKAEECGLPFGRDSIEDVKAEPLGKMNESFSGGFRLLDTVKLRPSGVPRTFGGTGGPTRETIHESALERRRKTPDEWWPPSFPPDRGSCAMSTTMNRVDTAESPPDTPGSFTKTFVAVHGIGEKMRNSTVRSVATDSRARLPVRAGRASCRSRRSRSATSTASAALSPRLTIRASGKFEKIGFSAIFWADLPKSVQMKEDTLEETKAWARTLVARARSRFEEAQQRHRLALLPQEISDAQAKVEQAEGPARNSLAEELAELQELKAALEAMKRQPVPKADAELALVQPDFSLAGEVLDEVIETVYVLENLTFLAEKAGLFTFDLREVLEDYVGDVQLVTEFAQHRHEIIQRFHEALTKIPRSALEGGDLHRGTQ